VDDLFSALRGMLRPLLVNTCVSSCSTSPAGPAAAVHRRGKVSQILRNFISNALKFTERGEVRVTARRADGDDVVTSRWPTPASASRRGPGADLRGVQVDGALQRTRRGTGLGLPLSRKLARLLGGDVGLESAPGRGSTFTLTLPREYTPSDTDDGAADAASDAQP
jgi:signal transduction histidine kinase